ncbi:hypothetical protein [Halorussus pelagicus]|uniref:hypothetical protein n=1 Tax=Halorussus pelagicus TaxID=2505977 RepID=UPI00140B6CAE|nr:hypothetical protein [Halorussus pelagicus]
MNRRDMLARFGGVLAIGSFGGCLGQDPNGAGDGGDATSETTTEEMTTSETTTEEMTTEETTTEETATDSRQTTDETRTTDDQQGALAGTTFEVVNSGCGQPRSEASVAFGDDGSSVVVTGTISGANGCYTAKLANSSYDAETGALDLTVVSMAKEGTAVCAQCIAEIEYEATVSFADDGPASVSVTHSGMGESKTVATAESS